MPFSVEAIVGLPIVWKHTGDAEFPYTAEVSGRCFTIRINDFPAEPLYTLLVDGNELADLEDWPSAWEMPSPPEELLALLQPKAVARPAPEAPRTKLHRLARILEERGMTNVMRPLLRAVEVADEERHFLEVSALARRLTLLVPYRAEVLAELAPDLPFQAPPPRPLLEVFVEGDRVDLGLVGVGDVPEERRFDVAAEPARAAWAEAVAPLFGTPDARVTSRCRYLTRQRATVDVLHAARASDAEDRFVAAVTDVASRIGIPRTRCELWTSAHQALGAGAPVVVTTASAEDGPAPELAFMYGKTDWDDAVRLCQIVAGEDAARGGAAVLGTLAATLHPEGLSSVQLALRADGADVVAVVKLR